eukprot:4582659-Amphidinium_carterae.1
MAQTTPKQARKVLNKLDTRCNSGREMIVESISARGHYAPTSLLQGFLAGDQAAICNCGQIGTVLCT